MSRVIAENLLQKGQLIDNNTPTWSGFTSATFATGATGVTGASYSIAPATGDYVTYVTSGGSSGSFIVSTVSSSGSYTKNFSVTTLSTGGIPVVMTGGSTVLNGYRAGVNGGQSRVLVVTDVSGSSGSQYTGRCLSRYASTGDSLHYVTTTGSSGSVHLSYVASGSQIVGSYYNRVFDFDTEPTINVGTFLVQTKSQHNSAADLLSARNVVKY